MATYANKKVKVLSEEHLKHIIEVTQMEVNHHLIPTLLSKIDKGLFICFDSGFDDDKDRFSYEYLTSDHKKYTSEAMSMEEIFINQPNDTGTIDIDALWDEFVDSEGYDTQLEPFLDESLAKDFANFILRKQS